MSSGRDASSSARKMLAMRLVFCTLSRRPSPVAKKRSRALSLNDRITPNKRKSSPYNCQAMPYAINQDPQLWERQFAESLALREYAKSAAFDDCIVFEIGAPGRIRTPNP